MRGRAAVRGVSVFAGWFGMLNDEFLALPEMKCRRGCEDPRLTLVSLP